MITKKWKSYDTTTVTIAAPGKTGQYLGLSNLTVTGDQAATITVQSPSGTTIYSSQLFAGGGGFVMNWAEGRELLGAENAAMVIAVSAGTYTISVDGVTYG